MTDWAAMPLSLLVAPLLEETAFRLGLQESLLRHGWPAWRANAVVAVLFGATHGVLHGGLLSWATALPAWAIGWQYQRGIQGRRVLWPSVLAHAACNGLWWWGGLKDLSVNLLARWT